MIPVSATWFVLLVGTVLGVFVGMAGTSGAFMIPALVYVFGLTQLSAQGTSLYIALLPIWIAPLWAYARAGNVEWKLGTWLAVGMALGGFAGGLLAQQVPQTILRRGFAMMLFFVAVRMFLQR